MDRSSILLITLLAALIGLLAVPALGSAAELDPRVQAELDAKSPHEYLSVILFMADQADVAGLDAELKLQRASRDYRHEAVVTALQEATASQTELLALLEAEQARGEVAGFTSYWISNLVVVKATKTMVLRLAARDDIARIEPNFRVELIAPEQTGPQDDPGAKESASLSRGVGVTNSVRATNADQVWYELGITGAGTIVANCDTGVDGDHPALTDRWRGNFAPASECWLTLIGGNPNYPEDDGNPSHGTHVMGTITGLGAATEDTVGIAWGALWIATDPINQGVSSGFDNDIITAFEWFADPDGNPGTLDDVPDVVQNSWGVMEEFWPQYDNCDSRWWNVIDNCEAAGVVTTWSAGNEGDDFGDESLRSPADRATTATNCFAIGAVNAEDYSFPYPLASFSSLGPTGCDVEPDLKIKPEVVAPGVNVYSSVDGGGYQGGWNGTSMAGPHVAGVVALMREANPDLDVVTIKEILMATAVDLGPQGEENSYGHGFIDAYQAVLAVMSGFGRIEGTVLNASDGYTPVPGALVEVPEADRATTTAADGTYSLMVPAGTYDVGASHPSFSPVIESGVVVDEDATVVLDFDLDDIGAPEIHNTTEQRSTEDETGPYTIEATITDFSALTETALYYRTNGGAFQMLTMAAQGADVYRADIPGQPHTTHVEYYVTAADVVPNRASDPPTAPDELYDFYVAPIVDIFADDIESGAPDWTHGNVEPGFGDQWHQSTQRNYTPGGTTSWKCGDTGSGDYANLLDAGLVTPEIELGLDSYLHFWHWMDAETSSAYPEYAYDGGLIEISIDGGPYEQITPVGGYDYLVREGGTPGPFAPETPFFSGSHGWEEVHFDLSGYEGSARIRFRFGSDGAAAAEGWYLDDIVVDGFQIDFSAVDPVRPQAGLALQPADPNPFLGSTRLHYRTGEAADVLLQVFDASGRLVRTLVRGTQPAGDHTAVWDGRDGAARPVAAGLYFSRLQVGHEVLTEKVILAR